MEENGSLMRTMWKIVLYKIEIKNYIWKELKFSEEFEMGRKRLKRLQLVFELLFPSFSYISRFVHYF